jgi:dihydroxyacetone kinase-like protein
MKDSLTLAETKEMFRYVAREMIASQDQLTNADRAIGDGDHGVGMSRGFEAVLSMLDDEGSLDLEELFGKIGMSLITSVGGAAGIIFGTWFIGGGKGLTGKKVFNAESLVIFLQEGLRAVQERGKAKGGDKTMVDVMIPASMAARECFDKPLLIIFEQVVQAAQGGMENTRLMVASVGKAKTLGERSLGYADPGAISASLILDYMCEYIKEE